MQKYFITLLAFAAVLINNIPIKAQLSQGGIPPSFSINEKVLLAGVPYAVMPVVNAEVLRAEDVYNDRFKDQPWRFGKDQFVSLNPENSGIRDKLADGSRLWRLGITSAGALTINLTFDNYRLPEGARLFIYNADRSVVLGAFTSLNNQEDRYFATYPIPGDSIVIEYYEPANAEFPGELNLWRVTHGYRLIETYEKAFGSSGSCNVNAVCPEGDPIRDQIRSVALIVIGGSLCSGALINNTNNDGTPLFLSANHCYGTPGTVVFKFNWQSATCSNPSASPPYNTLSGATQRARYSVSDFWLMELNQVPPAEYNVYYSGWNRTTASSIPGTVYCIHHPAGDIKKISWATGGVNTSEYPWVTGPSTSHWQVVSWSDGTTTEGGSSGSPLLDPQYRIIGQLHGGLAACENTESDYYGNLSYSWTGGGTNASRLSTWLDPVGTGFLAINGYDPNQEFTDGEITDILSLQEFYGDTASYVPEIVIRNGGNKNITSASIRYRMDYDTLVTLDWNGDLATYETDTIKFDTIHLTWGTHTFTASIDLEEDDNSSNDSIIFEFTVFNCNNNVLPYTELFNDTILPFCWDTTTVNGSDGNLSFVTEGAYPACTPGEGTAMIEYNSFTASIGSEVRLISPGISTISVEDIYVNFQWFHDMNYISNLDKMTVQYSLDGVLWNDVQEVQRYDASLSGWQNYSVLLPADAEEKPQVFAGFLFHSEKGNNCHLDSVAITGTISGPYTDFSVDTTFAYINDTITFTDASLNGPFSTWEWDFGYGATPPSASGIGPHKVVYGFPGKKSISLLVDGIYSRTKINYLTIDPIIFTIPSDLFGYIVSDNNIHLIWDMTYFSDGFESGDYSSWDEVIEGSGIAGEEEGNAYWFVQSDSLQYVYEGDWSSLVNWGYDINTWIITPEILISNTSLLSFMWSSSYYWHVDPYDNGDFFVRVSHDNGATWTKVWTFGEIGIWDDWAWYLTVIDLSVYQGEEIKIAFNLIANNNADVALDKVMILQDENKNYIGTSLVSNSVSLPNNAKSLSNNYTKNIPVPSPFGSMGTLQSYSVYRNDEEIAQVTQNSYLDENLKPKNYTYYVVANYIDPVGSSGPSNEVDIYIAPDLTENKISGSPLRIFPNPSDGVFHISTDREYTVSVMNINGIQLDEIIILSNNSLLDLSKFGKGIYILHFRSDNDTFVFKVLVQ